MKEYYKYYAHQRDDMVYERVLNVDGVADTLRSEPYKPWLVRDYGEKVVASQDNGIALVLSKEDFDKKFSVSHRDDSCGVFECFHCGSRSVVWNCDYDYSDFGYEGEGIVQVLHCENCGARIEYYIETNVED